MANGKGGSAQKPNPNKRPNQCHRNKAKASKARADAEARDAREKAEREERARTGHVVPKAIRQRDLW
jgi:hypothetical protein